jgi:murein peptide amidase A
MSRSRFLAVLAGPVAVVVSLAVTSSPATAANCTVTTSMRQGARSADVKCLETRLIELGYAVKGPDNLFGSTTAKAVRQYQKANGLKVDGIVGPKTGASLGIRGGAASPAPAPAGTGTVAPNIIEQRVIGTSVQGREIVAYRLGTPGGRVALVVGQVHGDEPKGVDVAQAIRTMNLPAGIDLWVIDTLNPDGLAAGTRQNANKVDLNRNFEQNWGYIPLSTNNRQYSGEAPADQPETQALQAFVREIKPAVTAFYHQDAARISLGGARKEIPREYARLVGLPSGDTPCTAGCTGTAGTFVNRTVQGGTSFLVEMPNSRVVTAATVTLHAQSFLAVVVL